MSNSPKKDLRTTQLIRRLRGKLFRASRLLDQPDTPWRRRRLLDSLASHGQHIHADAGGVLYLTVRVPYGEAAGADGGLLFPGGKSAKRLHLAAMSKIARQPALARIARNRVVVLDTETTGLLDRPETVPFLVGLGYFGARAFVVEQFFMEDFESEPAMMKMLARRLRTARAIFSYNGKAFDLPLLRRRFAVHRLPATIWKRPHWDILPTTRRLWGKRVRSRSLINLENEVFGFHRTHDIQSNRIPQAYHDYLGGRRAERLAAVFDHNAQDILTTAAIAIMLARGHLDPQDVPAALIPESSDHA